MGLIMLNTILDEIKNIYNKNKKLLLVIIILFVLSLILGYSGLLDSYMNIIYKELSENISNGNIELTTLSILRYNLLSVFINYCTGIFFGLGSIFSLVQNSAFVGYFAAQSASSGKLLDFILLILPHGIFEFTGLFFVTAAGLRVGHFVIRICDGFINGIASANLKINLKYNYNHYKSEITESLKLLVISVILFIIAAIIEANFTIRFYEFIISLF